MKYALLLTPVFFLASASSVLAQFGDVDSYFTGFTTFITNILIPLVFALALLMFLWGVFQYFILGGGDSTKRADGQQLMLWGIIAFVVMVAIWGIVNLIVGGLGLDDDSAAPATPTVPTTR